MKQVLDKTKYGISKFHIFVDFRAAYDIIRRDQVLEALKEFKIVLKKIKLVKLTLKHVRCRVKIQSNLPEQFETSIGSKQGDAVTCILFDLALEKVVRDSEI
jgi:sorting nexin-29